MSESGAPISGRVIGTIDAEDVANGGMIVQTGGTTFTVGSEVDVYLGHEERLTREEWEALARPARPYPDDMSAEECEAELKAAEGWEWLLRAAVRALRKYQAAQSRT